jgi:translocation and assembly module TamB
MPEERLNSTEESEGDDAVGPRRAYFTRRNFVIGAGSLAILAILIAILSVVSYRYGVFDDYIKAQFVTKMADIGVDFDADVFRVTVSPLVLELKNATFNDRVTGDKLFFVRDARLGLTVRDLYAWQLSRDISIDTTEVNGAEIWVKFDENGRSNFANLRLVEDEAGSRVKFKYESVSFVLKDSVAHFGDHTRKISGDARNLMFLLSPVDGTVPDGEKSYNFEVTSTGSNFDYDGRTVEDIDIRSNGIADRRGAQIKSLEIKTPIGESFIAGNLTDWASPKYSFDIQSSVDLTQASSIFGNGTSLVGVGNFKGTINGEGENYRLVAEADAQSLRAGDIALRAVNVAATVEGFNTSYDAHGTAIAEMLTFDDFRIDFLKLVGNIRGTGTDFRWVGDLQAAALKTNALTIGGLYLSDALADYKDRELSVRSSNARAKQLLVAGNDLSNVTGQDFRLSVEGDVIGVSSPNVRIGSLTAKDYQLRGAMGRDLRVNSRPGRTELSLNGLRSQTANLKDARLNNLSADEFHLTDNPSSTAVEARNLRADRLTAGGNTVTGLSIPALDLQDGRNETVIHADSVRVASVNSDSAALGSLNIGGVRVSIRQGRVEARSNSFEAGKVVLAKSGGSLENVRVSNPVYILEPSGRYRASADMTLGGGTLGSIALGSATARLEATNDRFTLNDLTADVMNGRFEGTAIIASSSRGTSTVTGTFSNLDLSKLLALQGGRIIPLEGEMTGDIDLRFQGTDFRTSTGSVNAQISANAGSDARGRIPVNGNVRLDALNGLFTIEEADLHTERSTLTATGRFDLRAQNSDLNVALRSSDASEIDRLVRVLGVSQELENQLDSTQAQFAGNLAFDGKLTGNLTDPVIDGKASLESLMMRGRQLGSVATIIFVGPAGVELRDGRLQQVDGGAATFAVTVPTVGTNNMTVNATLTNINAGNLLAALPVTLPDRLRDFEGQTSGTVSISGLPNDARGSMDLAASTGTVAGQRFDGLKVKALFNGTRVDLEQLAMSIGQGRLTASGSYERIAGAFDLDVRGQAIPAPLLTAMFPPGTDIPAISGSLDFEAKATGISERPPTYNINFDGVASDVRVNETSLGRIVFKGQTVDQILTANLTGDLEGRPQVINTTVDLRSDDIPFQVATTFDQSPLSPFLAFVPQLKEMPVRGTATGKIEFGGNLTAIDPSGKRVFTAAGLTGRADLSQLALQIQDTPLSSSEPVVVTFDTKAINFVRARFSGGGSDMTVAGTKALTSNGRNDLSIDGRVNLNLLNLVSKDTFFSGFADTSIRYNGPNDGTARLSGTANVINGSVAAFLGSDRFIMNRIKARVIFTTDQVAVEDATGFLGGGRFTASGGGTLKGLDVLAFRVTLNGTNVTVPLPQDFTTTGDARLEISGEKSSALGSLQTTIRGRIYAKRALYSKDIDLPGLIAGRPSAVLSSGGGGSTGAPLLDLVIEGRDALVVKNNIADLTASVSLAITGDAGDPRIAGRITANRGTIFFRNDRYVVQRAVIEFPPDTAIEPIINLQAETEIAGYQIFVNLSGPLRDSEQLAANFRSSPALPQADVVSLITTGSLANTTGGIPTLAQTGINTAAEVLTDAIITNPIRKATDKLFGLNVFEIDPLISGQNLANPSARLTVGRQINNKLRVTYSTNLSQDQNQVLAFEYRLSDRMSLVAQYEQRSLGNVTRNRDNFSFEVRFRKRF